MSGPGSGGWMETALRLTERGADAIATAAPKLLDRVFSIVEHAAAEDLRDQGGWTGGTDGNGDEGYDPRQPYGRVGNDRGAER